MNEDGSGLRLVGPPKGWDLGNADRPAWSSDGQRIAFAADLFDAPQGVDASGTLFIADPFNGGGVQPLGVDAPKGVTYRAPWWSPDGASLIAAAQVRNSPVSYLVTIRLADGRKSRVRTPRPPAGFGSSDFYPAWSPDGARGGRARGAMRRTRGYATTATRHSRSPPDIWRAPSSAGRPSWNAR